MSRCEHGWGQTLVALTLLWAPFSGCSHGERSETATARPSPPVVQADTTPLPDFHQFVVGTLEEPTANDRDPFSELRASSPTARATVHHPRRRTSIRFVLRGIVEQDGRRVALFARGAVGVGESLAGWTVTKIEERSVVLRRGNSEKRLSL